MSEETEDPRIEALARVLCQASCDDDPDTLGVPFALGSTATPIGTFTFVGGFEIVPLWRCFRKQAAAVLEHELR